MASIDNRDLTIEQAFKSCFYVVPDYQREYVWTEKQVKQLLEDINEHMDSSSPEDYYFIGTILVSPRDREKSRFDVIDGQQRLTTTFLILCALRVLFGKKEQGQKQSEYIYSLTVDGDTDAQGELKRNLKLEAGYENAGEVIKKIVEVNGDPQVVRANIQDSGIHPFGSVKKILDAYEAIYRFLDDNYNDEADLKKYWGHLTNRVIFIQISTDFISALKIFETINARGVGLSPMDLLKNLLFTQVPKEQFSQLKNEWKNITRPLEKNKEKPLRFLRYFLMANYDIKNKRNDAIVREDEIYDWFSNKENATLTDYQKDPFEFVRQITHNVKHYTNFIKDRGNDGEDNLAMKSLKILMGKKGGMHYVLLLAATNLPKRLFDQFVAQLESFLFFYIFTKTPTKELEPKFSVWADEVRKIAHLKDPEEQLKKLNEFVSENFAQNMDKKKQELEDALKRLTLHSMQQYRIRYFLARLTQHVNMAFRGEKERGSLDSYSKLEIEHILPIKPKDDLLSTWQEKHPDLSYDELKKFYDEQKNLLGNLTLLEKSINAALGNNFYESKVPKYAESGNYLTRSLSGLADVGQNTSITRINKQLLEFKEWDAKTIEKRQLMLIDLAKDIWKTTEITA